METDTYRRLENAVYELRVSQVPSLALAYRVDPLVLFRELGLVGGAEAARSRPERASFGPGIDRDLAAAVASIYPDPEVAARVIEHLRPLPAETIGAFLELARIAEGEPEPNALRPSEPARLTARAAAGA
jgi:hypothetical protein